MNDQWKNFQMLTFIILRVWVWGHKLFGAKKPSDNLTKLHVPTL